MDTQPKQMIPTMVVLSCDHAGLQRDFQTLENEIRRVLDSTADARKIRDYLFCLRQTSREWLLDYMAKDSHK